MAMMIIRVWWKRWRRCRRIRWLSWCKYHSRTSVDRKLRSNIWYTENHTKLLKGHKTMNIFKPFPVLDSMPSEKRLEIIDRAHSETCAG